MSRNIGTVVNKPLIGDVDDMLDHYEAEIERLRKALQDIASDICSRSGQVDIAKKALAGEAWE